MNAQPVVIIDDSESLQMISDCIFSINPSNEIIRFNDGAAFLSYMKKNTRQPFLIICNVNLAKLSGTELRKKITGDAKLFAKCSPFLFFAKSGETAPATELNHLHVHGYFIMPEKMNEAVNLLRSIISYWTYAQYHHRLANDNRKENEMVTKLQFVK